jgi:hypothetical protein
MLESEKLAAAPNNIAMGEAIGLGLGAAMGAAIGQKMQEQR